MIMKKKCYFDFEVIWRLIVTKLFHVAQSLLQMQPSDVSRDENNKAADSVVFELHATASLQTKPRSLKPQMLSVVKVAR